MTVRPPLSAQRRDLREARKALTQWLSNRLPGASNVQLSEVRLPDGAGVANETLLFDATWTEGGADRTGGFVARIESSSFLFMEANFDLHPKIIGQVAAAGIPVPTVVGFEYDQSILGARFFVMGHVPGQVPADQPPYCESGWLVEATADQRRRLWHSGVTTLARLHDLDAGRFEFLWQPQLGRTGLKQHLQYNLESFEWAAQGRAHPVLQAAAQWLQTHLPEDRPTAFAWGDARIGNMIFQDWSCVAVLDWDMASLAGAETDLAWWILFDGRSCRQRRLRPAGAPRAWHCTGNRVSVGGGHRSASAEHRLPPGVCSVSYGACPHAGGSAPAYFGRPGRRCC